MNKARKRAEAQKQAELQKLEGERLGHLLKAGEFQYLITTMEQRVAEHCAKALELDKRKQALLSPGQAPTT